MKESRRADAQLALATLALALVVRVGIVLAVPHTYAFDAFQRWAARDHLFVRDWLPATQAVIVAVTSLGGDAIAARLALAVLASLGAAAGAVAARRLGGADAGWLFVPLTLFGPYLTWSTTFYQEGLYLSLLLGALALALPGADGREPGRTALRCADLLIGLAAFTRYEGWPVALLWIAWRREPAALFALWGAVLWLALRAAGVQGAEPSPIDYADWEGLATRFELSALAGRVGRLLGAAAASGGLVIGLVGALGLALLRTQRGVLLLAAVVASQLAALLGWLAGVEAVFTRMQVVPVVLLGIAAPIPVLRLLDRLPHSRRRRRLAVCLAPVIAVPFVVGGYRAARDDARHFLPERRLARELAACEGCRVAVWPRRGLGSRQRHDGCEVLQGVSELRVGRDFVCVAWEGEPADVSHRARWRGDGYELEPVEAAR